MGGLLSSFGLVDLLSHFWKRIQFQNKKTWWQVLQGKLVRFNCHYILGKYRRLFETVGIRDPRNFSLDNFALHAQLLRQPIRCHGQYLWGEITLSSRLP